MACVLAVAIVDVVDSGCERKSVLVLPRAVASKQVHPDLGAKIQSPCIHYSDDEQLRSGCARK